MLYYTIPHHAHAHIFPYPSTHSTPAPAPTHTHIPTVHPLNPHPPHTQTQDIGGGKELDNIIASSLQQLESARAFYEQMQARVKNTD